MDRNKDPDRQSGASILEGPHSPPPFYDREPSCEGMTQELDVMVPMRDGTRLCIDIYRPEGESRFPVLLALAAHNKDMQRPEACEAFGPQPAWSPFWMGIQEAGDTRFFVSRGYVHVVGNTRGSGKSEDGPPGSQMPIGSPSSDAYDLIEWIAAQPWCDGNVGMVGISLFAGNQWWAAMTQPPHLKAIFPYDAYIAYSLFRETNPGGVLQVMGYLMDPLSVGHLVKGRPGPLSPELEKAWDTAMDNRDYKMYGHIYNVLTQKGQHMPLLFHVLVNPYDRKEDTERVEANFDRIKVPAYTGAGWYAYSYTRHLQGAQHWYEGIQTPKKLLFPGPAHVERPFHSFHGEMLRWYDYWLKGIDTGVMDEPPVKYWVMGANEWRYGDDWPLPETQWKKLYLETWERLREEPFLPSSRDGSEEPDAFVQMPLSQTKKVQKLRYMTDPLPQDTLVAGPSALYLYASIDEEDTNWIIILKDVGPDVSVRTAREGETEIPSNLPERELTRGWLKASCRALDPERSKPWKPWHRLTREARQPVVPGEINEYIVEILSTANLFRKGHRICVEISSMDVPTGIAGLSNVEYIPYHICSSKTTLHKIYHNRKYPSHLLLPVIPKEKKA
jgi:putative CocE/NonD family hydrolase